MNNVNCGLYHDTRSKKKSGKFPVKIRVNVRGFQKRYYSTGIDLSISDFDKLFDDKKSSYYKRLRISLLNEVAKAEEIAMYMPNFTWEKFENKFLLKTGHITIDWAFDLKIKESDIKPSTKQIYLTAKKSFKSITKCEYMSEITPAVLKSYDKKMLELGRSDNTIGINMRTLRAVFNHLIHKEILKHEQNPFGKLKYTPPSSRNVKRALTKEQLAKLWNYEPKNEHEQLAIDVFKLIYLMNGINIADLIWLKKSDVHSDMIIFRREKTRSTTRKDNIPIKVYLTDFVKSKIDNSKSEYLFEFDYFRSKGFEQARRLLGRKVNQFLKPICEKLYIPKCTTYTARHTFATIAVQNGAPLEYIQEALGHGTLITTQNYFKGFADSKKKEVTEGLLDFLKPSFD